MKNETPIPIEAQDNHCFRPDIIKRPTWWKPAIESNGNAGCLCCGGTAEILDLDTKLYFGVVGWWNVLKNGQQFYDNHLELEYEEYYDLKHIEEIIAEDTENEYLASFDSPLRSAVYQRHAKNAWVLIEKGEGFA